MTLPLGSIVHLTSVMIKAHTKAVQTMPDTPNMYSADLEVMDDHGGMDLKNILGKTGVDGQAQFAYRNMDDGTPYGSVNELPNGLTDSNDDVGKYWVIPVYNEFGVVVEQWAWVWRGTAIGYRKTYMGSIGPAGPVPKIRPSADLIDPDDISFVDTGGSTLAPTWRFNTAVPVGPSGPPLPIYDMPDFKQDTIPNPSVLMHDGTRGTQSPVLGKHMWKATSVEALTPQFFSVPESAFADHTGTFSNIKESAVVTVGSFLLPAQNFDWTPVVWGHTSTGRFINPFRIGLEVRLGDAKNGLLVARGFGNPRGDVTVLPHYSFGSDKNANVSPTNDYAVIGANDDTAVLYMNLINEGLFGLYNFKGKNAQLMVLVSPIDAYNTYTPPTTRRVT